MPSVCCDVVSTFEVDLDGCIISVNTSSRSEFMKLCETEVVTGPVIGSLNMTAYVAEETYVGCQAGAGVSIPWISKYDCDSDKSNGTTHFLFGGEGNSYITGTPPTNLVTQHYASDRRYLSINANAGSGPSSLVQKACRQEGYGLTYTDGPISFDTSKEGTLSRPSFIAGLGAVDDTIYLQSFSIEFTPGGIPTASYSFVFAIGGDINC